MKNFTEHEKAKNAALIKHSDLFDGAEGGGQNDGEGPYSHILDNPLHNLYSKIRDDQELGNITWWKGVPTGDTVSSQISCVNHLLPIARNEHAVKAIVNGLGYDYDEVLPIDEGNVFIKFDIKETGEYLNETRTFRTEIDAVLIARKGNINTLIIFTWEYTGQPGCADKSVEDRKGEPAGSNSTGIARMNSYNGLIDSSRFLKSLTDYQSSIYYLTPFYELTRQTLWASNKIGAKEFGHHIDDYLHIHVIPDQNINLLEKEYPVSAAHMIDRNLKGDHLKETWTKTLTDGGRERYRLVSPEELFKPLAEKPQEWGVDPDLIDYLRLRYW